MDNSIVYLVVIELVLRWGSKFSSKYIHPIPMNIDYANDQDEEECLQELKYIDTTYLYVTA